MAKILFSLFVGSSTDMEENLVVTFFPTVLLSYFFCIRQVGLPATSIRNSQVKTFLSWIAAFLL